LTVRYAKSSDEWSGLGANTFTSADNGHPSLTLVPV
jgi:hypothetical protein